MLEGKNILAVQDDSDTRELISFNLKNEGYKIFEAKDGKVGIDNTQKKLPDLILLDLMPSRIQDFEF